MECLQSPSRWEKKIRSGASTALLATYFATSYAQSFLPNVNDGCLAGGLYLGSRSHMPPSHAAAWSLGCAFSAELAQGVGILPGTYDTKDLVAYALGVAVAYAADRWFSRKAPTLESRLSESNTLKT